ncbi:hypothetical protein QQF64_021461 [Cirrhinus molitorella]|uniref:Uncharacterized protein n=1 Tax=Cirrhinus molitorella TaxID=172907 RepID=A0ABR3LEE2_9TELE
MDSAGPDQVRTAMTQQGILLGQHATQLTATSREVDLLTAQVAELNARVQELQQEALASRSAASLGRSPFLAEPEPHANSPPPYDGDPNSCRAFLSQCSLVFALQPRRYVTEESQVVTADLSGVPAEYHDLGLVFSRSRATSLPPHRPVPRGRWLPTPFSPRGWWWDPSLGMSSSESGRPCERGRPRGGARRSSIPQFLSWLILSRLWWIPHSCLPQPELLVPLPTLTLRQH